LKKINITKSCSKINVFLAAPSPCTPVRKGRGNIGSNPPITKNSDSQLFDFKPVAAQQPIKHFFNDGSKMPGCKASEIVKNEAYFPVRRSDER